MGSTVPFLHDRTAKIVKSAWLIRTRTNAQFDALPDGLNWIEIRAAGRSFTGGEDIHNSEIWACIIKSHENVKSVPYD
jgi:hypothetical protein